MANDEHKAAQQGNNTMRPQFEEAAWGISRQYSLDLEDVKNAYQAKPASLTMLFDSMQYAKAESNSWVGWSVAWLILAAPMAIYTGYRALEHFETLNDIGDRVKAEIGKGRTQPDDGGNGPDIRP